MDKEQVRSQFSGDDLPPQYRSPVKTEVGYPGLVGKLLNGKLVAGGHIPKKEAFLYSLGIAGQNISVGLVGWLFYYCTDVLRLEAMLVGVITSVSRIFDAINDPVGGVIMDRHRFKSGDKLRPFVKYLAPIIGILAMMLFINPGLESQGAKMAYIMVIYLAYDLLFTFQDIAQWGLTAVMSPLSDERAKVSQWARIGGTVGSWLPGLITILISLFLALGFKESTAFAVFGVFFGFGGMMISMFNYKAQERVSSPKPTSKVRQSFKLLFKNRTVMLILLANILKSFALVVPNIYFFKYVDDISFFGLHMSGMTFAFIFGIVTGLPGTLAMLVATKIAKLLGGMKNVLIIASAVDIISRVGAYFLGYQGNSMTIVMLILGIASIPNGIVGICSTAIWGDSLDEIELKTGERAEAVTFAAQNFLGKATAGIALLMNGIVLTILTFDANLFDAGLRQSDTFFKWIWPVFILGPAMGNILFLIPMFFVKYNQKTQAEVEAALKIKRAEKAALEGALNAENAGSDAVAEG